MLVSPPPVSRDRSFSIRRLVLDVDKAVAKPSLVDLAEAIGSVAGVDAVNLTVNEIDIETVGLNVTIEGSELSYAEIVRAIERVGAAVHSIDQLVAGDRLIEETKRTRS